MRTCLALLALSSSVLAAEKAAEAEKAELKKLEGTWVRASTVREGKKTENVRFLWVFEGNRATVHHEGRLERSDPVTWTFQAKESNKFWTLHFKLDPTQSPKTLDERMQFKGHEPGKQIRQAIYKLEDDTLTICYAGYYDRGKRPESFTAEKGSDREIVILKREKK